MGAGTASRCRSAVADLRSDRDGGWDLVGRHRLGRVRIALHDTTLYTSRAIAEVAPKLLPGVSCVTIPVARRIWGPSVGVAVVRGHEDLNKGSVPWVVVALAPGRAAADADLRGGDRVSRIDGEPVPGALTGVAGTTIRVTVLRGDDSLHSYPQGTRRWESRPCRLRCDGGR